MTTEQLASVLADAILGAWHVHGVAPTQGNAIQVFVDELATSQDLQAIRAEARPIVGNTRIDIIKDRSPELQAG